MSELSRDDKLLIVIAFLVISIIFLFLVGLTKFSVFIGILRLVSLLISLLVLIFLIHEYQEYCDWKKCMKKVYKKFDEYDYDFKPLFSKREKEKRGLIICRGSWGVIYDNGLKANFMFKRHSSIVGEFKYFNEIQGIYPWVADPKKKSKYYNGIQIETSDLKVCVFTTLAHPLHKIIPSLVNALESQWKKLYHPDKEIVGKSLGIHHEINKLYKRKKMRM